MLLLQAFFLWLVVSALVTGGAMAFHRRFPDESPWLGFLIPPLAFVILLDFIEHLVALPTLLYLLPLFLGGIVWLAVTRSYFTRALWLPTGIFLASFAFAFGVRCLRPDISFTSDGVSDLNMVNNFSQGQTLPPPDCWLPPFRFEWYYDLQHYGASVIERLLGIKIGVATNVAHGLLSAFTCVAAAGATHRLSGGRTWIAVATPLLIESAATGTSAYILLSSWIHFRTPSLWLAVDLSGGMASPPDDNPLWKWLAADPRRYPIRLQVPGFWTWRDEYHANSGGHFLTLLGVLALAELGSLRRTIWPWILAVMTPLIAVTATAWALPITALLCWGGAILALICGRRPSLPGLTALFLFIGVTLLWPAFYNATSSPEFPDVHWGLPYEERAPLLEFLVQWWPMIALWICGLLCFRTLPFSIRWLLVVAPVILTGIELVDIESRYNMIEKMWGYTWGAALIGLFPIVAIRVRPYFEQAFAAARLPRPNEGNSESLQVVFDRIALILRFLRPAAFLAIVVAVMFSATVSLIGYMWDLHGGNWDGSAFQLEGNGYLRIDDQKRHILQVMSQVRHATFLSGKTAWCYNEAPALAVFTGNKSYIAWTTFESLTNYKGEVSYRDKLDNDFYSGAMTDRLHFLQANNIAGVLVWPGDALADDALASLRKDLEPSYEYVDCKGSGDKNAGIFLQRPLPRN